MSDNIKKASNSEQIVQSPCVGICALDDNDICIGCFRSGMEISQWGRLSNEDKKHVLLEVERRMCGDA